LTSDRAQIARRGSDFHRPPARQHVHVMLDAGLLQRGGKAADFAL
jgi:hypothetical protein